MGRGSRKRGRNPRSEEDKARERLRKQKDDMSEKEVRRLHEFRLLPRSLRNISFEFLVV